MLTARPRRPRATAETDATTATASSADCGGCPFFAHPVYAPLAELPSRRAPAGSVWLALHTPTDRRVVVKLVERGPGAARLEAELLAHRRCGGHPLVARLLDAFLTPAHLAVVLEDAEGGELGALVAARGALPEGEARWLFRQLAAGLHFLRRAGVRGRGVRLDNVRLAFPAGGGPPPGEALNGALDAAAAAVPDAAPAAPPPAAPLPGWAAPGRAVLKLQGFAYARTDQVHSDPLSALGELPYTAPEVLSGAAGAEANAAPESWALGVALFKAVAGRYPFERPGDAAGRAAVQAVLARIARAEYEAPPELSLPLRDLLARLLVVDPAARLRLEGALQHPWLAHDAPPALAACADPATCPCLAAAAATAAAAAGVAPPSEAELRALVAEAARPLRGLGGDDVEAMADELLDEEEADELLDELRLGQ